MGTKDYDLPAFNISNIKLQNAVLYMLVKNNSLLQKILDYQVNGTPEILDESKLPEATQEMKEWLTNCQKTVWVDLISQFGEPEITLPPDLSPE